MHTFYIQAILTASLGGILYGYDMGVISGALPLLSSYFQLTPSQEEWIVSLLYFGGGVGAASGGFLCDWFGRKTAILFTDVVFGIGAFLLSTAETVESVMIGRCVVGWAVAVSGIADVVYLHEISSVWEEGEGADDEDRMMSVEERVAQEPTDTDTDEAAAASNGEERRNQHDNETGGRGSVVSVNEACISLGFLLAFGAAYVLGDQSQNVAGDTNGQASETWRSMFAFGGFIAAFQFLGMLCMPESPVWLHGKGMINEAASARNKIRGAVNASGESGVHNQHLQIPNLNSGIEMGNSFSSPSNSQASSALENSPSSFSLEDLPQSPFRNRRSAECFTRMLIKIRSAPSQIKALYQQTMETLAPYKKQCAIAFFLAASQQFCGHPSVLSYSAEIFAMLNPSSDSEQNADAENTAHNNNGTDLTPIELTVGIGILKFLTTCIVILCIEKGGRRLWLLSGMSCILLSLTFLCIAFIDRDDEGIGVDSDNAHQQPSSSFTNGLGIVGIYGVAIGYAASYGPLTWLITSELFPSSIRGRALGFATVITYMAAGLVSRTFLGLADKVGLATCFALYWIATFFSIVFVWLGVPDTGGEKKPAAIGSEMNDMWIWGGRKHHSSPLFLRWRSRSGERPSRTTSWTSLGGYGSWGYAHDNCDQGVDSDNAVASSVFPSSPGDHSGLTPRRSSSSNTKEII